MVRFTILAVSLLAIMGASTAHGQDTDEAGRLKKEVELLQAKLEAANLKIEKLQKENEQLKAGPKGAGGKAGAEVEVFQLPEAGKENCANAQAFIQHVLDPACKAGGLKIKAAAPGTVTVTVGNKTRSYILKETDNWRAVVTDWINDNIAAQGRCNKLKSKDDILAATPLVIRKP